MSPWRHLLASEVVHSYLSMLRGNPLNNKANDSSKRKTDLKASDSIIKKYQGTTYVMLKTNALHVMIGT